MNWQHLTYFQTVADTKNFSRAAEQLFLTPSALSKSIHALEAELGFPLFEKRGRNSVLTEYGKTFLNYVTQASSSIENGLRAVQEQMDVSTGKIRVSGIYTMCAEYLPTKIRSFKEQYPKVTFSMEYSISSRILESVLEGESDLGFCGDYEIDDSAYSDIERVLLKTEDLIVIVPFDHKFSGKELVDFRQLKDEQFIIYRNVNSGISYCFWELCRAADITPEIAFEVPDDHTIIGLVEAGLGIALIADSPSLCMDKVSVLRFEHDTPIRNQYMVWKRGRFMPPVVRCFRDHILDTR
ncbi:MAG: LysR family transcriptional regulator [Oscillospiraceae bacterium]|nr:LysR family transcriptional regulator [Oscillospiraceae bacterium]